jgi:hypothetical protein
MCQPNKQNAEREYEKSKGLAAFSWKARSVQSVTVLRGQVGISGLLHRSLTAAVIGGGRANDVGGTVQVVSLDAIWTDSIDIVSEMIVS